MDRNRFILIFIVSILFSFLYGDLVTYSAKGKKFQLRESVFLVNGEPELRCRLDNYNYMLKIKHVIQEGPEKEVYVNGERLVANKILRKKIMETAYYNFEGTGKGSAALIKVRFPLKYPPDIDIRLQNFAGATPDGITFFLKSQTLEKKYNFLEHLLLFSIFMIIFSLFLFILRNFGCRSFSFMSLVVLPALCVMLIFKINNLLPFFRYFVLFDLKPIDLLNFNIRFFLVLLSTVVIDILFDNGKASVAKREK
ncbi:MAG: hypothetical protein KJ818_07825 [Candidatus Omnitrophica bacterium]|nr:hypothetical protein [Candidatus Omnitrophota bacterium]